MQLKARKVDQNACRPLQMVKKSTETWLSLSDGKNSFTVLKLRDWDLSSFLAYFIGFKMMIKGELESKVENTECLNH